jgi:hypothetical protein
LAAERAAGDAQGARVSELQRQLQERAEQQQKQQRALAELGAGQRDAQQELDRLRGELQVRQG